MTHVEAKYQTELFKMLETVGYKLEHIDIIARISLKTLRKK